MTILAISAKGKITLEPDLLTHLGLHKGQSVDVEKLPNGELRVSPVSAPQDSLENFIGRYKGKVTQPISIEEMNEIIAEGWVK